MLDAALQLSAQEGMAGSFQFYLFDGPHEMKDQYGTR